MSPDNQGSFDGKQEDDRKKTRKAADNFRDAAMLSAPTMLIVFPLVGFALGCWLAHIFHWPLWVAVITLLMGFVQGIREVIKLGNRLEKSKKNQK
ncbi:MAG: AtpZ/AtpI family protein [bacterium]